MKVVITKRIEIVSKGGKRFTICKGVAQSGDTVEFFESDDVGVSSDFVVKAEDLETLFSDSHVVDVQFDQRGRVISVEAV